MWRCLFKISFSVKLAHISILKKIHHKVPQNPIEFYIIPIKSCRIRTWIGKNLRKPVCTRHLFPPPHASFNKRNKCFLILTIFFFLTNLLISFRCLIDRPDQSVNRDFAHTICVMSVKFGSAIPHRIQRFPF